MKKHLSEPWFSLVRDGKKTIEGRLNKGEFVKGMVIEFWNGDESFHCIVEKVVEYPSFRVMAFMEGIEKVLPGVSSVEEGVAIYRKFYSEEDEKKGVVAISLKRIRYFHWSREELDEIEPVSYEQSFIKPIGFWVSVDNSWEKWCKYSRGPLGKYCYEVFFDSSRILSITGVEQLVEFIEGSRVFEDKEFPDWSVLAEKYDGIFIYNYEEIQEEIYRRYTPEYVWWFYGWDCSSGCIWNVDAIKNVKSVK